MRTDLKFVTYKNLKLFAWYVRTAIEELKQKDVPLTDRELNDIIHKLD